MLIISKKMFLEIDDKYLSTDKKYVSKIWISMENMYGNERSMFPRIGKQKLGNCLIPCKIADNGKNVHTFTDLINWSNYTIKKNNLNFDMNVYAPNCLAWNFSLVLIMDNNTFLKGTVY